MPPVENQAAPSAPSPAKPGANGNGNSRLALFRPILLLLILVLASAGLISYMNQPKTPQGVLELSGRVEGYETNVGAKVGGRVDLISYREGDVVKRGDLIAQISDDDIQAQLRGADARIEKAKAKVESAKDKLDVLRSQISECDLRVSQSSEESVGRIRQWESNVAMSEARLAQSQSELIQSQADLNLAKTRKERYEFLVSKGAVSRDEYDQVINTYETVKALVDARKSNVNAAEKELKASHGQLAQAQSSRLSPHIQAAEKVSLEKQLKQAEHDLKQAVHEVDSATAESDQTKANIAYLRILSPIDGVVTARVVEPGAVVVPGQTILSLINLDTVYLRAYVPEGEIGKVRVGQGAKVFLDARPDSPFAARVIQIDPQGSFTPENIYFKSDRVKQVFGVKIAIEKPGGFAKPGMPADAQLNLE